MIAPGKYLITNAAAGTAFDLSGAQERDDPVHGWTVHKQANQQWLLVPADKLFFLKSVGSDQYARVCAGVVTRPVHGSTLPMLWRVEQQCGNQAMIIDPTSGLAVELLDGNPAEGTPIQLKDMDATKKQQRWVFQPI